MANEVDLKNLPSGWVDMPGHQVGSDVRDTNEPGGSRLLFLPDYALDEVGDETEGILKFDIIDIGLPSMATSSYDTSLLAQVKYATQGIGRLIAGDQITATIECPGPVYGQMMGLIGCKGTCRIEIPNQKWFSQWRVAIMSVDGPSIVDGDRMTGGMVFTVTNTGPDDKSEMGPVYGVYTPEGSGGTGGAGATGAP